jgi:stage IV sporulation protein FB
MDNFEPYIPPKPNLVRKERNGHPAVTIFSMVLFALTFSILIDDYLFIAFLLLVILIHEAGHYLTMKIFGYKKLKMLFIPFMGALVQGKKKVYSQTQSAWVLLAGPIPGMIVGFVLLEWGLTDQSFWILQLSLLFILLNAVNLLPIDPLDGGQLIRVMILGKSELFQLIFSFLSSISLIVLGLWLDSYILIIFGFLLGFRVKSMYSLYFIRKDMKAEGINYETTYERLTDATYAHIKRILIANKPVLEKIQEEVDEMHFNQLMANQVDSVLQEPMRRDAGVVGKVLFMAVWLLFLLGTLYYFLSIDINQLTDAFRNR